MRVVDQQCQGRRPATVLVSLCCLLCLGTVQPSAVSMLSTLDNLETQLEQAEAQLEEGSEHTGNLRGNAAGNSKAAGGGTEMTAVQSGMAAAVAEGQWDTLVPLVEHYKTLRAAELQAALAVMGGAASPPPITKPAEQPVVQVVAQGGEHAAIVPERFLTFMWNAGAYSCGRCLLARAAVLQLTLSTCGRPKREPAAVAQCTHPHRSAPCCRVAY
jgi:hypothetical protein